MGRQRQRRSFTEEEVDAYRAENMRFSMLMRDVYRNDTRRVGDVRENLARKGLKVMQERAAILSFEMTQREGWDDTHCGIDAFVYLFDGRKLELQVKGSPVGVQNHHYFYPKVPVVMISEDQTPAEVARIICDTLKIPMPPLPVKK